MGFVVKPIRKARERYRMHELLTNFSYCFNGRVGDELKLIIHILLLQLNFHFFQENVVELIVEKIVEAFPFFATIIFKIGLSPSKNKFFYLL